MYALQLLCLSALLAAALALAPEAAALWRSSGPYPVVVMAAVVALVGATLVSLVLRRRPFATGSEIGTLRQGGADRHVRLGLVVAVWIGWAALAPLAGFIAATAVALFASARLAGLRGVPRLAIGSIVFALVLTVLVKTVLYVAVPEAAPEAALERFLFRLRN